jgi:hypothetical protein
MDDPFVKLFFGLMVATHKKLDKAYIFWDNTSQCGGANRLNNYCYRSAKLLSNPRDGVVRSRDWNPISVQNCQIGLTPRSSWPGS